MSPGEPPMPHVKFFLVGKWHFPKTTWRKLHYTNLTVAMTKQKSVEDESLSNAVQYSMVHY